MRQGFGAASLLVSRLRIALVLLALAAMLALGGCAARHGAANNAPGQTMTSQQSGGQTAGGASNGSSGSSGSSSAAQQIQDADQQVQDAMNSVDNAQNDANNTDNQSGSDSANNVP